MNFSTPSRVLTTIRAGDNAESNRGENRTKINNAANCVPQLDAELAKKLGLKVNVNWGELMNLLANARRQYRRAFYNSQFFFNIGMPYARRSTSRIGSFLSLTRSTERCGIASSTSKRSSR